MSHSKKKFLNTEKNKESKEFQRLEKLPNIENKLELKKFQEKSQSLTIMLSNILDNTFLNTSQKNKLNTLQKKEKLKNINTFQLKDKLYTILKLL